MDELVERCLDALRENVFIDDAHLLGTTQQDMRMEHYTRAIIPIVADWQRERDAGLEDELAEIIRRSGGSIIVEPMGEGLAWASTDTDADDRVWHEFTAIRGAE